MATGGGHPVGDGTPEPVIGPATPSGVSGSSPSGMLGLGGVVPWVWLAGCRACGRPHELRFLRGDVGEPLVTWADPRDGHTYRPRLGRHAVDALMVEHRAGVDMPESGVLNLADPGQDVDYVTIAVPKLPEGLAAPVVDAGGHRWLTGARGVLGMRAEHEQVCGRCAASRRTLLPPGWSGGDVTWVYPDGHLGVCPGVVS